MRSPEGITDFRDDINNEDTSSDPLVYLKNQGASDQQVDLAANFYKRNILSFKELFNLKLINIKSKLFEFKKDIALHELGHYYVAQALGWQVIDSSIDGHGPILGWVTISFPGNKTTWEIIKGRAAIALAGFAATGSSEGCGSDFANAAVMAQQAYLRSFGRVKPEECLSEARSKARELMPSFRKLDKQSEDWAMQSLKA